MTIEFITDTESEKRVLSAMLHSDVACIDSIESLKESDFYEPFSQNIFTLISKLYRAGINPTYVEVMKEGHTLGVLTTPVDMEKLKYVAEHYIEDGNVKWWVNKVKEAAKGRAMQRLVKKYTHQLETEPHDVPNIIREASGEIFALAMDAESERIVTAKELAEYGEKRLLERIDKYRQMQEEQKLVGEVLLEGVPTGFPLLNKLTLGYKPGDLILLAAQTGHGKTAFAIQTACAVCVEAHKSLFYINTEMTKDQLVNRWGTILSGIPMQQIRDASLRNEQIPQALAAYKVLSESGFFTSHLPNLTPAKADILTRKAKMQYSIEIMILDYVGRMEKFDPRMQEWQVLEQIVKTQKQLAQNLEIACMILAQLNPDGTLQGAQRMKNECDLMLKLIPVPDQEAADKIQSKLGKAYEPFNYRIFVDKARDTQSGFSIPIVFDMERQQIREAQQIGTIRNG